MNTTPARRRACVTSARIIHAHRNRAFVWGCGQMPIVTAIGATGAGPNAAAYLIERAAHIGPLATCSRWAIAAGVYLGLISALDYSLVRRLGLSHEWLPSGTAAVVAVAIVTARSGVGMAACLVIVMLAPAVRVIGYEASGYRHQAEALVE